MSKEFVGSLVEIELQHRAKECSADISRRYQLPPDVAERVVEIAANLDQAYAIAELMR